MHRLPCAILLSLLFLSPATAGSLAGQDIRSAASATFCSGLALSARAAADYCDPSGTLLPTEVSDAVSTSVLAVSDPGPSSVAVTYVAPENGARVYCTSVRSLYSGPDMSGLMVRLAGVVRVVDGVPCISDGSVLDAASANGAGWTSTPLLASVRCDLTNDEPAEGAHIVVSGACRREADGSRSVLPFSPLAVQVLGPAR